MLDKNGNVLVQLNKKEHTSINARVFAHLHLTNYFVKCIRASSNLLNPEEFLCSKCNSMMDESSICRVRISPSLNDLRNCTGK